MSSRFDNRTVDTFKKQIKFSTQLEKYFFYKWIEICSDKKHILIKNPRNNGVDNSGEFIESGKTSGADYLVDFKYKQKSFKDMPIEIKWVPTYGKLTLKVGDLKAYIRERAAILFIYHSSPSSLDLRLPKDYNLEQHIEAIEANSDLKWGLMTPDTVESFLTHAQDNNLIKNIHYMGNKPGIVLRQASFADWLIEESWDWK